MALLSEKIRIEKGEFSGDYFVVFAVKVAKDNQFGIYMRFIRKNGGNTPIKTRAIPKNGSPSDALASSIYSIFKKLEDVNAEFGESNEARSENQEKTENADMKPGASERKEVASVPVGQYSLPLEGVDQEQYDSRSLRAKID